MTEWFRRQSAKIKTTDKREIAEGMWLKCPECRSVLYRTMLEENHYICINCTHHFRITSNNYIQLLIDDKFEEIASKIQSVDPLNFKGNKYYKEQLDVKVNACYKTFLNYCEEYSFKRILDKKEDWHNLFFMKSNNCRNGLDS